MSILIFAIIFASIDAVPDPLLFPEYPPTELSTIDAKWEEHRDAVVDAFKVGWDGYRQHAWGHDELRPVSNQSLDWLGGLALTIVDSLDTIWIMGLNDEYLEALDVVVNLAFNQSNLENPPPDADISVFESVIRYLGGLLSAYGLTGERKLLTQAQLFADSLLPIFPGQNGQVINSQRVNLRTSVGFGSPSLAEAGTTQLEFKALSYFTGDPKYKEAVEKVSQVLIETPEGCPFEALRPLRLDAISGYYGDQTYSIGGDGDSYYEYLLKQWIQNSDETSYLAEYREAMTEIHDNLLFNSTPSNYTYVGKQVYGTIERNFEHLTCFLAGLLALGSLSADTETAERDMQMAKGIMRTCYNLYMRAPHGLMGDSVNFIDDRDFVMANPTFFLRTEVLESLFILFRITGDDMYRDWAWDIFQAIKTKCQFGSGYSDIQDVTQLPFVPTDKQESFMFAESFKYLYLIFSPPELIPLDMYVFNTEAHPLLIFNEGYELIPTESPEPTPEEGPTLAPGPTPEDPTPEPEPEPTPAPEPQTTPAPEPQTTSPSTTLPTVSASPPPTTPITTPTTIATTSSPPTNPTPNPTSTPDFAELSCSRDISNGRVDSCERDLIGTKCKIVCNWSFDRSPENYTTFAVCSDGNWTTNPEHICDVIKTEGGGTELFIILLFGIPIFVVFSMGVLWCCLRRDSALSWSRQRQGFALVETGPDRELKDLRVVDGPTNREVDASPDLGQLPLPTVISTDD